MEENTGYVDGSPAFGNIREEWSWVRPALEEILSESPDVGLIPEDIYSACRSGNATLWVVPEGMLITRFQHSVHSGEKTLEVWFAWARERGGKAGIAVHNSLEPFAKSHGCAAIEFATNNQTFIDYCCQDLGYRVSTQILRKDLG